MRGAGCGQVAVHGPRRAWGAGGPAGDAAPGRKQGGWAGRPGGCRRREQSGDRRSGAGGQAGGRAGWGGGGNAADLAGASVFWPVGARAEHGRGVNLHDRSYVASVGCLWSGP
jgi:hypothetical protein